MRIGQDQLAGDQLAPWAPHKNARPGSPTARLDAFMVNVMDPAVFSGDLPEVPVAKRKLERGLKVTLQEIDDVLKDK